MTVSELIAQLEKLPGDLPVMYDGGDFQGDWTSIQKVEHVETSKWGQSEGVYLL